MIVTVKYLNIYLGFILSIFYVLKTLKTLSKLKIPNLHRPSNTNVIIALIIAGYIITPFADSFTQEADYLTDAYLILLTFSTILNTYPIDFKQAKSVFMIVICIKMSYFFDKCQSMNF